MYTEMDYATRFYLAALIELTNTGVDVGPAVHLPDKRFNLLFTTRGTFNNSNNFQRDLDDFVSYANGDLEEPKWHKQVREMIEGPGEKEEE